MRFLIRGFGVAFVLLFLLLPTASFAEDSSPIVEKKEETVGRVTLESKEYPLDHYRMEADIGDGFKEMDDGALHAINQGMWGFNKTIASFTLYSINELMSFDLISSMAGEAGIMSERIYQLMSGAFFSLFIIFIGASAAWRYFVNQQIGHAVKAILGALMITVATFWFFSNATGNIQWLNERGSELEGIASSANVLLSTEEFDANEAYNSNEGVAVLENQLFNLMIKRPYLLLNYGSTKESEVISDNPNRVDNLLEIKPFTDEGEEQRGQIVQKEVSDYENKQMSPKFSGERFGYLIITILSTIALAIPVLLLGAFKFLLQVWFLALVIFTAIPLVLSLIPAYSESALNHGKKLVGVLMMKAGLVLLISVITGLVTLLYESVKVTNGVEGYAFVVFLICLTMWGLFKYRSEIFEVASAGMVQGQQVVERATTKSIDKVGEARQKTTRTATRMVGKTYKSFRNHKRYSEMGERISDLKASTGGGDETRSDQRIAAGINGPEKQKLPNHKNVSSSGQESTRSAARNAGSVVHLRDYKKGKAPGANKNESTGSVKTTSSPTKKQSVTRKNQLGDTVREPNQHGKQESLKAPVSEKRRRETSQKAQEDRVEKKSSYRKLSKDDRVVSSSVRGNKHTEKQELSPVKRSSRSIQPVSHQRKPESEKSSMRKETAASKESSKPITKWEAQQQIDQRRFKSSNLTRSRRRKPGEYVLKRRR
ncbi:CD3337/EF1877 family mobilome membrane protein [Guptibacillus sedimenti]|uniref:CD3337/EF1877 family mobilome membrane protein n=1 Tax=Guptibacillus sedimenti TaxID=3025680 RepID=UPI00236029B0|nr:hypothetical protein [Pseudalkalibacillus sedimenti]